MRDAKIVKDNKRVYRKITPELIAKFQAAKLVYGSGAKAIRILEPDESDPRRRAWLISTKCKQLDSSGFLSFQLEQIGVDAINRIGEMVNSRDESVATKNSQYVIDQLRGMPTKRKESLSTKLTIESVID